MIRRILLGFAISIFGIGCSFSRPLMSQEPKLETTQAVQFPELRLELLELVHIEQYLRGNITGRGVKRELANAIEATDRYNASRVEAIIEEIGWPSKSKVGKDGAHAAWSIVQHAVFDPMLMIRSRDLMKEYLYSDEIEGVDYAYLYDRIASVLTMDQQLYGIVRGVTVRDEHDVEERRQRAGFDISYAEYLRDEDYRPPNSSDTRQREIELKESYAENVSAGREALEKGDEVGALKAFQSAMKSRGYAQVEDVYSVAQLYAQQKSNRSTFDTVRMIRILVALGFDDADRLEGDPSFEQVSDSDLWREALTMVRKSKAAK